MGGAIIWRIILTDANGVELGEVDGDSKDRVMVRDIEVEWSLHDDLVFYARAKAFNLKTGKAFD